MNNFVRGKSSKEALEVGLTAERKVELLLDIKKRTESTFFDNLKDKETKHKSYCPIRKITTSFYDWEEGLPSRVLELWSEDTTILKKNLTWLEWDFCLESLKPIAIEAIQTHPPRGEKPKILYRHQYIIKKNLEELVIEVMG